MFTESSLCVIFFWLQLEVVHNWCLGGRSLRFWDAIIPSLSNKKRNRNTVVRNEKNVKKCKICKIFLTIFQADVQVFQCWDLNLFDKYTILFINVLTLIQLSEKCQKVSHIIWMGPWNLIFLSVCFQGRNGRCRWICVWLGRKNKWSDSGRGSYQRKSQQNISGKGEGRSDDVTVLGWGKGYKDNVTTVLRP